MVKETFIQLLESPQDTKKSNINDLKSIIERYPYFQSAQILYLKTLKNIESFKYNNQLKKTAAHTTDRTILFDFITSPVFNNFKEETEEENTFLETTSTKINKELTNLEIGKPLTFYKNETFSFQKWLELSTQKPILRKEETKPSNHKLDIINRFISNNPKISKLDKTVTPEIKITEPSNNSQLMTETLAKVYLEQKKYENAIKAYEILSLKYPEKSSFFADRIKQIRILQKK